MSSPFFRIFSFYPFQYKRLDRKGTKQWKLVPLSNAMGRRVLLIVKTVWKERGDRH